MNMKFSLLQQIDISGRLDSTPEICRDFVNMGADGIFIRETFENDAEHEINIDIVRKTTALADAEIYFSGGIKRLEDVKKYLYAGAAAAVLDLSVPENAALVKEAASRFGGGRIAVLYDENTDCRALSECAESKIGLYFAADLKAYIAMSQKNPLIKEGSIILGTSPDYAQVKEIYNGSAGIKGICFKCRNGHDKTVTDYMSLKAQCKNDGIPANIWDVMLDFDGFVANNDGLVPVVVQDYRTNEVLMLAYMNREAFERTVRTGRMTYYSRSRGEIWEKGLTSGHFQYVKSLSADCDKDTILAKVFQTGAACHTGKYSCFFNNILKADYRENNPYKIIENVFSIILDRKENPKEGSYTNYLFDKGIDKILKKVGEEAAEIIIAAKNPNKEEIKYEIADFLYHILVLMAVKGVSPEEIMSELARR